MAAVIVGAGAVGGVVNALLSSNNGFGIQWPKEATGGILQLGVLGNVLLGAFAALITWGLYGPLKDAILLGSAPAGQLPANLTVTAVVGGALAGAGGARVISGELDKKGYQIAGVKAALEPPNQAFAMKIATSPASAVLAAGKDKPGGGAGPEGAAGPGPQGAVPAAAAS